MGVTHLDSLRQIKGQEARQRRRISRQSPLASSSVTRGGVRVASAEGLRAESVPGGAPAIDVTGRQRVSGELDGSGSFEWTGPWSLDGDGNITGDVGISGAVDITGILRLLSNLIVATGGKITVGTMVIDPAGGGSVTFPGGAKLDADPGGGVRLTVGTNRVFVGANLVSMQMGSRSISISASGIQMSGLDTIPSSLAGGASPGTIWTDGNEFFRVV